jgi:hypothetical protein
MLSKPIAKYINKSFLAKECPGSIHYELDRNSGNEYRKNSGNND